MLAAAFLFSTGGLLMKLSCWNPLTVNGVRNLIACGVIGTYLLLTHHKVRLNKTIAAGAVCVISATTMYSVANRLTTAGNTVVLQYTAPVWVVILMYLLFRKKPGRLELSAIGIVLAGIICFFIDSLSVGHMAGDLCALCAGLFFAGMFMMNTFENGDALSSMFIGQLITGVVLSPLLIRETDFRAAAVIPVLLLGLFQIGISYIFFSYGTANTDPVTASVINALEPILNPILVAVFYGEMLGRLSLAGAFIVIGGVLFYNLAQIRKTGTASS